MRRLTFLLPLLALAAPLAAEPGLPDEAAVAVALDDHPSVAAARARLQAAEARAEGLKKGPQEFTFSGSFVRRSVDREGEFDEYDAQLSRAFRLPGKARLDREIGAYGIEAASNLAEDARHQAALLLAMHWFDWLSASAQARVDRAAVANYEKALAAVTRRMELRDAAQLDVDQANAALASARLAAEQSSGLATLARTRLETHFPALALPAEAPEVPLPEIADAQLSQLRDHVISNSHEIAAAEAEARRMEAVAARASKDRMADPSIGLRLFSERSGAERGAGLVFSLPLGGGHRKALADEAGAGASAARAEEQLARFAVQETANADVAEARYRIAAWQRSRETVAAQMAALEKLRRGQQLGEIDLADLLLAERMVHDAFRIEAEARAEAMRAITKLRIDSHELWLAD
ncbi:TolC family protein [Altererythrobacter sp. FM1]|uniref:TolC family protein n=1 Tax=Tsuneonella flava TaxID=2055955 RepID=A0ABX7K886_9SPHN|nr:TolC family protein [Tsuneonella flava]QSB43406.1 TolC family protein [Tsuneonella flava]ROT93506.1 TolC family protein [Altererythrobacter sp. FM1]